MCYVLVAIQTMWVGAFDYILSYTSKECGKEGQRKVLTTQLQPAISKYNEEQQTSKEFK